MVLTGFEPSIVSYYLLHIRSLFPELWRLDPNVKHVYPVTGGVVKCRFGEEFALLFTLLLPVGLLHVVGGQGIETFHLEINIEF